VPFGYGKRSVLMMLISSIRLMPFLMFGQLKKCSIKNAIKTTIHNLENILNLNTTKLTIYKANPMAISG